MTDKNPPETRRTENPVAKPPARTTTAAGRSRGTRTPDRKSAASAARVKPTELTLIQSPYHQLGVNFLKGRAVLEKTIEGLTEEDSQEERRLATDALALRRLADGVWSEQRPTSDQDAVRHLISVLEEIPGTVIPEYREQHARLTEYLNQLIEREKQRQAELDEADKTDDGLPRRKRNAQDGRRIPIYKDPSEGK